MTPRRGTDNDLNRLLFPSQMALRAVDAIGGDDFPDFSTVDTNTSGRLKSPRIMRNNSRRKKREKKKANGNGDTEHNMFIMKVLKGDFDTVLAEPSTVIRIYICGGSADMHEERKAMQHRVYPELRAYCARLELDFHVVDLRGGADQPTDQDYATSGVYTREVATCQRLSIGPAFLMIIGDKYGLAPLPAQIEAEEFEIMKKMAEEERLPKYYLLEEWYVRDNNAIPPVYVLQSRPVKVKGQHGRRRKDLQLPFTDKRTRHRVYTQIQQIMQEAISVSIEEGKLIYQERKHKYFKASSEEEVLEGVLHCKNTADKCLCYIREFSDLPRNVYNEVSQKFTDMMVRDGQTKQDAQAGKLLQAMKSNVNGKLEVTNNLRYYEPSLVEYLSEALNGKAQEKMPYMEQLISDMITDLKGLTDRAKETLDANSTIKHFEMYKQILPHASWVHEITEHFIGREDFFNAVEAYIKDTEKCCMPLVIQGPAGYGKTCCMGMLAKMIKNWISPTSVTVLRFISETLHTADIKTVLHDVCSQLSVVYSMDPIKKESTYNIYEMAALFKAYLEQVSKWHAGKKPLVILLDGLDQLSKKHRAHSMQWLPSQCPPNVYLIVSTETSCTTIGRCLHQRLTNPDCFMDLGEVDGNTVELMVNTALDQAKRTLQPEQMDFLLRNGKANPHPIYLALTVKEAQRWCSYTKIDENYVPTTAEDAISRVLDRMETKYGLKLVRDMVSYLVMVETGLTETELTDVLSCNDEVLQDVFIQHDLPLDDTVVMPSFLIASLLDDLQVFLVRRNKDNKTVLAWRNQTYRALCSKKYFGVTDPLNPPSEESQHYCHDLAEIFLQDAGIHKQFEHPMTYTVIEKTDRQVTPQILSKDNIRKLKLLPWFIVHSGRMIEVVEDLKLNCFCNFNWLLTKLQGLGINAVIDELDMMDVNDNDLLLMKNFIRIAYNGLKLDCANLASHLLGMVPHISPTMYPGVAKLVSESRRWIKLTNLPLIVPILPCLPSPLDMCKQKIWGIVEVFAMDKEEQVGVMKNNDSTIEFWDIECEEMITTTGMQYNRIDPNIYMSDNFVAIYSSSSLYIWDIQTCTIAHTIELEKLLGDQLNTTMHMYHTHDFGIVVLQSSDDEFDQTISIIDTERRTIIYSIPNFDIKDEFYRNSAMLVNNEEQLVFIKAQSESQDDGSTQVNVTLNIYSLEQDTYLHQIPVGHKKFTKIILNKDSVVLCWDNASFDAYDLNSWEKVSELGAPGLTLKMTMCELTVGNNLFFLASTSMKDTELLYSALWCWNIQEQQLSQLFIKTHQTSEEVFEKFILCEVESFVVLSSPATATICLWDLQGQKLIHNFYAHIKDVTSLHLLTSDPFSMFTGSSSEGVVKRWDLYPTVAAGLNPQSRSPSAHGNGILKRQGSRHKLGSAKSGKSVRFADSYRDDNCSSTGTSRPNTSTSMCDEQPMSPSETPHVFIQRNSDELAMLNVCSVAVSQNGCHVVTGYEESPPVLWDVCVGQIFHKMAPQSVSDLGTVWVGFACKDVYVIGLTKPEKPANENAPQACVFQLWNKDTAQAVRFSMNISAITCTLTLDHEKVLLASIEGWEPNKQTHDIVFRILNLREQEETHRITYVTSVIPSTIQLTEDNKCAVTNNVAPHHDAIHDIAMFSIEADEETPEVMFYEFRKGKKYPKYRVTENYVMKNGLSMAVGMNGDLQMWDIPSCEYEGNLCEDPSVKDTQNPNLHTHNGRLVLQLAISTDGRYLVAASEDCTASLWDLEDETMIHRYTGHTRQVTAVAISNDNQLVVTGSEDCTLCIWQLGVVTSPICHLWIYLAPHTICLTPDSRTLIVLGHGRNEPTKLLVFRLKNIKSSLAAQQEQQSTPQVQQGYHQDERHLQVPPQGHHDNGHSQIPPQGNLQDGHLQASLQEHHEDRPSEVPP